MSFLKVGHPLCQVDELSARRVVPAPGQPPLLIVRVGPGRKFGPADLFAVFATHGGSWEETERGPGAVKAACTGEECDFAPLIPNGRDVPELCPVCDAELEITDSEESGTVIVYQRTAPPSRLELAEKELIRQRSKRPGRGRVAAAAREIALAKLEEAGLDPDTIVGAGRELLKGRLKAKPDELARVARGICTLVGPPAALELADATGAESDGPLEVEPAEEPSEALTCLACDEGVEQAALVVCGKCETVYHHACLLAAGHCETCRKVYLGKPTAIRGGGTEEEEESSPAP